MRISTLTEENSTAVSKQRTSQQPNNKIYKNYNNNNNGSSSSSKNQQQQNTQQDQQPQQQQQQQQQQQKTRTFPKLKYSNGNNNNNNNNSNNNKIFKYNNNNIYNNNGAHFIDGNYITGTSKNSKRAHYENNYIINSNSNKNLNTNNNNNNNLNTNNNNINSNRSNISSCSCSTSSTSNSRNSSPSLSLAPDESILNTTITAINTQSRHNPNTFQPQPSPQQQQQQQKQQNSNNNNTNFIKKQNSLSSSTDTVASKMIDNPITPTIYSSTWKTRNPNMITTATVTINCNNDHNNNNNNNNNKNENKICCQTPPLTTTTPITIKATVATLLSPKSRNSLAIQTQDLNPRQQEQQEPQRNSNILLSNAKVSSVEFNSPKNQRRNPSSSLPATTASTTTTTITISQTEQQQQPQHQKSQQSFSNDCSNSYQNLPRTQSTTARTKSSPNATTTSSSSSLPFPLGNNGTNNNNTGNLEHGSKGGGGGKSHHFNRKKFWKLSGTNSGGAVVISTVANSAGGLGSVNSGPISDLPTVNGIPSSATATTENNIVLNSASPKPTNNRSKNPNNRNHRYQPQSQSQYPETWKKNSAMSTTVTSTVTRSASANANPSLTISTAANKPAAVEDNAITASVSTMTTNTTAANTSNTMVSGVSSKIRVKPEEKITSDASTTTEKIHLEEKTPPLTSIQPQMLPIPLSPIKNRPYCDGGGSVNKNYPSGMPSYTLDFLHSVGKRMLAFGTAYPPATAGNRITSTANINSNATSQTGQQSGHRSNRYVAHSNNSGYGHSNQHHHHHPQPQQLTIASFLQKDMFASTTNSARGAGNSNAGSNNATSSNSGMSTENSPHTYNNQAQYQQHRFHNFYNHPPSTPHYYRHQGIYQAYNGQNGIVSTPANSAQRYHNSNGNGSAEHTQRQQPSRNQQQQRQHLVQQQQYGGGGGHGNGNNNNFNATTPNRKQKVGQQSKSPNLQNASSPSSSTSSLSSLTSTASSQAGGSSRQSNGSNKSNSRPNSAIEMMPPKNNAAYTVGPNSGGFRHNNQNRHHNNGHHFNHHGTNGPPAGAIMGQHQNYNNLTYVLTNGNGSALGPPPPMPNSHAANVISTSESSSRACSPSILSSSDNPSPEPSQTVLLGMPNRLVHPDQQPYIISTQNLRPATVCPPMMNINHNDVVVTNANKHESSKTDSGCAEYEDSECSSSQQSDDGLQRCTSFHQIRPASSLSQSSQSTNSQVPSPIEFAFNPIIQQIPTAGMHFQAQPYRNGMMPTVANLPPNGFHEDDFHLQGAIQQQLPSMFFTSTDQINVMNHNGNGFPNAGNVVYSQSAMTLIPTCPSTASNMSRSSEEESQLMSSRSSSSGSDQLKGSTPDISTDVLNEMHDQMGGMSRSNSGANTLPSARSRNARNQQHSHPIPPPFMHYPFNQQSMFCSNYLAYLRSTPSNTSSDLNSNTPPDRFMSRSHLVEVKETPPTLLNNSKWDNLSQQIWSKFIDAQQTEETFKLKMRLWRYLYVTIKQTYPRYGLYLVGSTMSGFGADTSDVDMCLVSRSFAFVEQRMEALFNLTILRECLRKTEDFESFNLIEAKVPILRFRDKSNHFEVDLNFNNSVGIKNTHLLYCYTQLDWRLRPLALIVKLWAQYHDINNAKNMTISSYSLVLMVVHFLQCGVSPPVLPCLHKMFPEKFTPLRSNEFGHVDMNDNVGPYESKNTQALGELFLNFLEYYSSFDYRQNAISVRTGGLLPVNVCRQAKSIKNDIHQWKELCIEEPFDLTNTARSVYDFDTFERVKAVFSTSFHVLQKTLELNSIFAPLVLPRLPISARIYMKRTSMPNSTLIPKVLDAEDHPPKSVTNKNEKSIDYCNEQKSSPISACRDDQAHIEEKTAGRGDATPATAL